MSDFSPTKQQQQAIDARGSAILVSAAAGSGKTRVLTQRLMAYLTETPAKSIDSFLIITYTRAAAGELRARITEELSRAMAQRPDDPGLRRQYALLGRAQIGTIHSFCMDLLRRHCMGLGLSPDFQVADETRAAAMKRAALTRTLEAAYERIDTDDAFRLLVDTVGAGRDDARLEALILKLHEKMQSHPDPARWAEQQRSALYAEGVTDAGDTVWGQYLLEQTARDAGYWADVMDGLLALMSQPEYGYIGEKYAGSIAQTADGLRDFSRAAGQSWDAAAARADIPFPRLGSLREPPDADVVETVKARRDACKKACGKFKTEFSEPSEKVLSDLRKTAPAMDALLSLTLEFDKAYAADKRRRGLVDYSDLEHFAARLLSDADGAPTPLARELSQRYTEIMVDEYQDVNQVQELIFRCVSKDGANLFTVGDVKQSIYRFRLADPGIFTEKYLSYADYDGAPEDVPRRILLQQNFRSRREILDGANAVFENIMSRQLGELDYDENARLNLGASYDGAVPPPTLYLLRAPQASEDEETPDLHAAEAGFVARQIRQIIDGQLPVTDGAVQRPARYSDIVLLMRSVNTVSGIYRQALAEQGIPVQAEQGGGYYESPEISFMMSLLAVIDNPCQDVPLIAVLRSPYLAFMPDNLAAIRACSRKTDFYHALCLRAAEDGKCRRFLDHLSTLRQIAPDLPLPELLWHIYGDFSILTVSSAMEDGALRRRNLIALIDLAAQFEASGYQGLRRFVRWLGRQAESGQEPPLAGADNADAVRIMSIHKSKGLEFPIVFLCDTARRFNKSDTMDTVLVHPDLGLGPKVTDTRRGIEFHSMPRRAIARKMNQETLSEEMRLLYVAMTRAKEYLVMTAALKDPDKTVGELAPLVSAPMPPQILANAGAPVQWLISAALADRQTHLSIQYADLQDVENTPSVVPGTCPVFDDGLLESIRENLRFVYPHAAAQEIPSKLTATELKHIGDESDPDAAALTDSRGRRFRAFSPGAAARLTAAQRGTATHLVFQHIDIAQTQTLAQVEQEIARLKTLGFLTAQQAGAVDARQIYRFFASPEGGELRDADSVLREFKFSLLRPAGAYFPGGGDDELLLQGVIDCAAEKNGVWTVIDYKTDFVTADTVQARGEFYRSQVAAYQRALVEITGKPVAKTVLYFLHPGISITF